MVCIRDAWRIGDPSCPMSVAAAPRTPYWSRPGGAGGKPGRRRRSTCGPCGSIDMGIAPGSVVGNRNITGSLKFKRLIKENQFDAAIKIAREQVEGGANMLDINMDADRWPDDVRLSDIEPRFICKACGKRGADVRPHFQPAQMGTVA